MRVRSRRVKKEEGAKIKREVSTKEKKFDKRRVYVCFILLSIFFMVLMLNAGFSVINHAGINTMTESTDYNKKFLLSGPDPYYNMRTINLTLEKGYYPWGETDYMLNYPIGSSGAARPPLMNMLAIGLSQPLGLFMSSDDAIGYSMQILPCIFGALLVFPIYFIGKHLFNYKAGLIAALLIPLIPLHVASGHGTAYTLFDHDAMNLFLTTCVYLFFILGLKSVNKTKSALFGVFMGLSLGALSMTWISAQFVYIVIVICFLVQVFINLLRKQTDYNLMITTFIALITAYFLYLPLGGTTRFLELTLVIIVGIICLLSFVLKRLKIPYVISIPVFSLMATSGFVFLYLAKDYLAQSTGILNGLAYFSEVLFGSGVYGTKIDLTIAEARTFDMSRTIMSFGPALFWFAFFGFILLCYFWLKNRSRTEWFFFITLFIVQLKVLTMAGRFLNDFIPLVAVLGGWIIYYIMDKINLKKEIARIKQIGLFRNGIRGFFKNFRPIPMAGSLMIVFLIIAPNAFLSFEASIPIESHNKYFGEDSQPYQGLYLYKEQYWIKALEWLSQQDRNITDPLKRPAFISWWDYGFYESAVGEHPTVADNFQEGIPTAANFHTARSEIEAVAVLSIRLLEGDIKKNGGLSNEARELIFKNLPPVVESVYDEVTNTTINETKFPGELFIQYMENPKSSPSYNTLIGPEWGNDYLRHTEQGAKYHDCCKILTDYLLDENMTQFYLDVENLTGYSIRYYGTEGYDVQIFPVFSFLADKGTHGFTTMEDEFQVTYYKDKNGNKWTDRQLQNLTTYEVQELYPFDTETEYKQSYYDTIFSLVYDKAGAGLKHFGVVYLSDFGYPGKQYPAVVIAKYYPGCYISGKVTIDGVPLSNMMVGIYDNYGIYHNSAYTNDTGEFKVLSIAGNISLVAILDQDTVIGQNNVFVTEDEANRVVSPYKIQDIPIENSSVEGKIDNITVGEAVFLSSKSYNFGESELDIMENGTFRIDYLVPGKYTLAVRNETGEVYNQTFTALSGNNTWNMTIPDAIG